MDKLDTTDIVSESELARLLNVTQPAINLYRQTGRIIPFLFKPGIYCLYKLSEVLPVLSVHGSSEKIRNAAQKHLNGKYESERLVKIMMDDLTSKLAGEKF